MTAWIQRCKELWWIISWSGRRVDMGYVCLTVSTPCGSSIERLPLLLTRLIDIMYVTTSKTRQWSWPCPTASHRGVFASRTLLSFRSSVRLYAWPVAECFVVISPRRQRCWCCRDMQTALVLHEVMGGNRFSMLSSNTKRYFTLVSCSRAGFMCVVLGLIVHW